MSDWISVDFTPIPICFVELKDGRQVQAHYALDEWETLDGQWIKKSDIVRWQPLRIIGIGKSKSAEGESD